MVRRLNAVSRKIGIGREWLAVARQDPVSQSIIAVSAPPPHRPGTPAPLGLASVSSIADTRPHIVGRSSPITVVPSSDRGATMTGPRESLSRGRVQSASSVVFGKSSRLRNRRPRCNCAVPSARSNSDLTSPRTRGQRENRRPTNRHNPRISVSVFAA